MIKIQSQVTHKWYHFGVAVGIGKDVLNKLTSYSDEVCIVEMLDYWLRNCHPKPTWRQVGEALKEIGLNQLGDEILIMLYSEKI